MLIWLADRYVNRLGENLSLNSQVEFAPFSLIGCFEGACDEGIEIVALSPMA
jgi:hypothetical protein